MQKIQLLREMRITHDCGGEFTLPDYVPAIGRMLSATCEPAPEGVYLKEADGRGVEAELGGVAVFRILYVPDGEGGVHGVTIPCDYDTNVLIGAADAASDGASVICRASTVPENVFCRVTAPRKLQLRCRLGTRLTVLSASDPEAGEELPPDMEVKRGTVEAMSVVAGASRDLLASSDLSGLPEGAEPVMCRAAVMITDCKAVAPGEYRCRGEIMIECLYTEDGTPGVLRDRIAFDEVVTPDGELSDETVDPRAYGRITSAELRRDDSGSRAEIVYELGIEASVPHSTEVIYDAYSVKTPVVAEYEDMEYLSHAASFTGSVSVNEHIAKSAVGRVPFASACADLSGVAADSGRVRLSGELRGTALVTRDGELDSVPWTAPWSCEIPAPGVTPDDAVVAWGDISVISASARADGELAVDAEVAVSATVAVAKREHVLSSVRQNGDPFPPRSGFTVCYPAPGDSAWEIAKRFHVPTSVVASGANLAPDGTPAKVVVI